MSASTAAPPDIPVLPGSVPVEMPDLPPSLAITTAEQFKAAMDPIRMRILAILGAQPATAKQVADRLGATPGAIGHHIHVLEAAGLVQVVARRLVRGIVASYYARTARIISYNLPPEVAGSHSIALDLLTRGRDELAESLAGHPDDPCRAAAFPHVRLSPERAAAYNTRLDALVDDLIREPRDPDGQVYSLAMAFFLAPPYLQAAPPEEDQP